MINQHEANSIITLIESLLNYSSFTGEFELSKYEQSLIDRLRIRISAENDSAQIQLLKNYERKA